MIPQLNEIFCNKLEKKFVATHGEDMHASNLRHSCCNSGKGSDEDMVESYEARTLQPFAVSGVRHASVSVSDTDTTPVLRSIFWTLQVSTCPCRVVSGVRVGVGAS